MINLITGKAASGKTVTIYDILATKSTENNIIITNPQSIEAYEKFLANNHIAATVLSINDAPASLSSILGYTYKAVASTIDKIAIISDIIRNAENLSIIKPNNFYTGVVDKILNAITDIKKEGVSTETFCSWADSSPYGGLVGMKISDLSYIINEYDKKLKEKELITEEDLSWNISNYIEENGVTLCDNLFIDTLPGYLNITINFICSLLGSAPNVYAAFRLTDSKSHDYSAFSDSMKALNSVKEYAEAHGYDVKNIKASRKTTKTTVKDVSSGIDVISENFFNRNTKIKSNSDSVRLYEASTSIKEVEFVCSEIKKLIDKGAEYDDITVASPIIEDYYSIIQQMFSDHDIPFHYFKNDNLANTQIFNMIKILLESSYDGITLPRIMQAAQINFLQLSDIECAMMDSFSKRFGDDKTIALSNCQKYAPDDYNQVVEIIAKIEENFNFFIEGISSCHCVQDYLKVIIDTLIIYNANESLFDDITKLYNGNEYQMCNDVINIWNSLIDVVNSLANISGEETMSVEAFLNLFEKICQNKKLVNNNKYFGEVKVLSLPDVPNNRSKHLFVVGCNEGKLVNLPDETFFTPSEKHILNDDLHIEVPENEYFINKKIADIYSAFTTPYNTLFISWPVFTTDYDPVVRASVIDSIYNIFKDNIIYEGDYSKTAGEADFLDTLCKISNCYYSGTPFSSELQNKIEEYLKNPIFKDRMTTAINNMSISRDRFNTEKGEINNDFDLSVTKAEKFNECPFKYFVSANLSPKEQKMFAETPANKGTFYHTVFCRFYNYLKDNSIDYTHLARDKARFNNIIENIIEDVKSNHNENVLNSSSKMKFTALKMEETIKVSVWNSLKQIASGDFRPEQMEYDIGKTSNLSFTLNNGSKVTVTGIADRIDVLKNADGEFARIIDYKSGNVTFSKEKFDQGTQLQLPLYMSALSKNYKFGGMYYFHIHNPYSDSENETNEVKEFKLSGPTSSESNVPESSDHTLNNTGTAINSEIVNISKTLKGEFGKRSDLISQDEADAMYAAAQSHYIEAAEGICSGQSIAAPAKTKTFSPCTYCPYKSICGKQTI